MTEAELQHQLTAELAWVRRLARLVAGDASIADDLAQDAWAISRHAPPDRPRRQWLGRVVRNLARMQRRSAIRRDHYEAVAEMPAVATPAELVARMEAQRAVSGAVLALDEPYRSTVIMRFVEDMTCADIARRLGIPEGTVRRRLKTALDRLRADLAHRDGRRSLALLVVRPPRRRPWLAVAFVGLAAAAIAAHRPATHESSRRVAPTMPAGSASTSLRSWLRPTRQPGCLATIYGEVRDASAGAITNAHVMVSGVGTVETDQRGRYSTCIDPLGAVVRVDADGYGTLEDRRIHAVDSSRHDFELLPETPITGRVIDRDGRAVGGAEVVATPARTELHYALAGGTAITDPDGRFRIASLAPGRFEVSATTDRAGAQASVDAGSAISLVVVDGVHVGGTIRTDGVRVATTRVVIGGRETTTDRDGRFELDGVPIGAAIATTIGFHRQQLAIAHDVDDLVIDTPAAAAIVGHARRHGKLVAGVRVWCMGSDQMTTTDAAGAYVLDDVAEGPCRLLAADLASTQALAMIDIEVHAGDHRELELDLANAAMITGAIVDAAGRPMQGVYVAAQRRDGEDGGESNTDERGAFAITTLGAGDYTIAIFPSPARGKPFPTREPIPPIGLADGDAVVSGLRIAIDDTRVAIRGQIVDAGGAAVRDVYVEAINDTAAIPPFAHSAADGSFTISNIVAGSYAIRAHASDGRHGESTNVTAGSSLAVIHLSR